MIKWPYLLALPLALIPVAPPLAFAQQIPPAQTQTAAPALSQAELEALLAPIALYPDDLLTQVLIASTYPLEVVMASRWVEQTGNKNLTGDALIKALDEQDWDPSTKSLVPFPSVLKTMSEQLEWTQRLGDAFLAQEAAVLAAVQALRARAKAAGALQTNAQQVVVQEASAIVIQPAQPTTVYVPAYNPTVVYGAWPYPSYPPVYYPPPPGYYVGSALMTGLAFGAGIAITGALWGWGRPNWGGGSVNVNVNRFNSINVNSVNANRISNRSLSSDTWQHNPDHRRGVGYSNPQLRQQYRPNSAGNSAARSAYRGRETTGTPALGQAGQRSAPPANLQGRGPTVGAAGSAQGKLSNASRPNGQGTLPNTTRANAAGGGAPAFRGVGNGAATRAQSAQGRASRQGMAGAGGVGRAAAHGGGGAGRAGGGAARGGRR
ncbi:MAG: DUF3300 domain-containing protein [Rhodopila sp.]